MTNSGRTRISEARRSSGHHDPLDGRVVYPLQIQVPQVRDPDPEIIEDPAVRLPLSTPRPDVPELVQQQAEEVLCWQPFDEGEGADRIRSVERVHQTPLADLPRIHLSEEDDLRAADGEFRPGDLRLLPGQEVLDEVESELQPPGRSLTG